MKIKATYKIDLPDDLHGDDIEEYLDEIGESICGDLVKWE